MSHMQPALFTNLPVMILEPLYGPKALAPEDALEADMDALRTAAAAITVAADHLTLLARTSHDPAVTQALWAASIAVRSSVALLHVNVERNST